MSKGKKKKRNKKRNAVYQTLSSPNRSKPFSREDLTRAYYNTIRNFYNDIAPSDMKVSSDTEFFRLARTQNRTDGVFGIQAFVDDIMFAFLATEDETPPEVTLGKLVEDCGKILHKKNPFDWLLIRFSTRVSRKQGYIPFDRKFLCIVQEKPTEDFLDKDEVVIDIKNQDYLDFAGEYSLDLIYYFEKYLNDTDVCVKIINKENHPRAYKDYLKLKKVMELVDDK